MTQFLARFRRFLGASRGARRLSRAILLAFLAAGFIHFVGEALPRDNRVDVLFQEAGAGVAEVRVELWDGDQLVRVFERHPAGEPPPDRIRLDFEIEPGTYRVRVEVVDATGRRRSRTETLDLRGEAVHRIRA